MSTRLVRGLWIGLVASAALNLFLGGMAFSTWMGHRHGDVGRKPFALMHRIAQLEGPAGEAVRARHGADIRRGVRDMRDARRAVRRAFAADPFDPVALREALAHMRHQTGSTQRTLHSALVELALLLRPEERRRLFSRLRRTKPPPAADPPPPQRER